MRNILLRGALWCGLWLGAIGGATLPQANAGVVVEGASAGIEKVQKISYLAEKNRFTINGGNVWKSPVPREDLLEIVKALRLDDRLGVGASLQDEILIFGGMTRTSNVAEKLRAADEFLRSIIYGEFSALKGLTLPANYTPRHAAVRDRNSTMYLRLDNFRCRLVDGIYWQENQQTDLMLIPLLAEPDAAGNPVPDYDALERGENQIEDAQNVEHILAHQQQYLSLPILQHAVSIGEAAAFIRHLRDCGFNLETLSRYLAGENDFSLTVSEANTPQLAQQNFSNYHQDYRTNYDLNYSANYDAQAELAQLNKQQIVAENIKEILSQDNLYGQINAVKMSRNTVNDGSYVAFRKEYLDRIAKIDLSRAPKEFQIAYAQHAESWRKTLNWISKQKISDSPDSFDNFKIAHAPFREELNQTYRKCKEILAQYAEK